MALDFEGVKARVSILAVAEGLTTLNRSLQGPCPKCGGDDRFYLFKTKKDPTRFVCSHCHPKEGDVIELIAWTEGISRIEACRKLGGDTGEPYRPSKAEPRKPVPEPAEPPAWASAEWQADAKAKIKQARAGLTPESEAGRYLASRGLDLDTWRAFRLGDCLHLGRPSVLIPHADQAGKVSAIKYRAFDDLAKDKGRRFTQELGSQGRLFGAHLLTGGGGSRTLILLEGEMNAASVWQSTRGEGWDVLSIGAEKPRAELVGELSELVKCGAYLRCLVWMDQADRAQAIGEAIRDTVERSCRVGIYRSPEDKAAGIKWDASELLKRGGDSYLADAVRGILQKACPTEEAITQVLAPRSPVERSDTQNLLHHAEGQTGATDQPQDTRTGDSGEGRSLAELAAAFGLIIGPPEPRASADPLTPAELSALAPAGQSEEAIKDALDHAYRPRRGSPLAAAILGGCRAIEDGIEAYALWLAGFTAEEG